MPKQQDARTAKKTRNKPTPIARSAPPWLLAATPLLSVLATTLSRDATACNRIHAPDGGGADWQFPSTNYYINVNDFTLGLFTGLSLTPGQTRFWIQWAAAQWRERTDSGFSLEYAGDTTTHAMACGGSSDGTNQIDVTTSTCLNPPSCTFIMMTTHAFNANSDIVEADICVSAPIAAWRVATPIGARTDLVGNLVHEFGHFTGLDHTSNTVMNSAYLGGTRNRYPFGDDIDCSYVKWGSFNTTRYVSVMPPQPGGNFGPPQTVGGGLDGHFGPNAAIGADNSGNRWLVVGNLMPGFNGLQFTRSKYNFPTQWLGSQINFRSRRPPSVASRPPADSVHLWGVAWTIEEMFSNQPNGIAVAASSDMFQTTSSVTTIATGSSVPQEPALFYDINSQRWGILFVKSDATFNDEIFATTSPDLVHWTTPQDLGFQTLDAPSASCVPFDFCTATWLGASLLDPKIATKSFTIDPSTGQLVLGPSRSSFFSDVPRNAGITASRVAGNPTTRNWLTVASLAYDSSQPLYRISAGQDNQATPGINLDNLALLPGHGGAGDPLISVHRAHIVSDPWDVDSTFIITTD